MRNLDIKRITILAVIAALYVAITIAGGSLSYLGVQFRISEALVLLCFYRKEYCISMVIGCAIANLFSPMWAADLVFGTFATLISVICIYKAKNLVVASLFPVIFNAIIIGIELKVVLNLPLLLSMAQVAVGELVCVTILGVSLFKVLEKNKGFMSLINFGESTNTKFAHIKSN